MKIIWTGRAVRDLRAISDHVAEHDPQAAQRIGARIRASIMRVGAHPLSGRAGRVAETRELVVPGTAYVIAYRMREGRLEILTILHGARAWPDTL